MGQWGAFRGACGSLLGAQHGTLVTMAGLGKGRASEGIGAYNVTHLLLFVVHKHCFIGPRQLADKSIWGGPGVLPSPTNEL